MASYASPVPKKYLGGQLLGYPYQGTHLNYQNWQSDNAVDISLPYGTPIYAVTSGTIDASRYGSLNSGDPHLEGLRVNLQVNGQDMFYYAHLSKITVKPGQRVKAGQLIGYSGAANGVNHLHFAVYSPTFQADYQARRAPAKYSPLAYMNGTVPDQAAAANPNATQTDQPSSVPAPSDTQPFQPNQNPFLTQTVPLTANQPLPDAPPEFRPAQFTPAGFTPAVDSTTDYTQTAQMWHQIASQPLASQDSQSYLQAYQVAAGLA